MSSESSNQDYNQENSNCDNLSMSKKQSVDDLSDQLKVLSLGQGANSKRSRFNFNQWTTPLKAIENLYSKKRNSLDNRTKLENLEDSKNSPLAGINNKSPSPIPSPQASEEGKFPNNESVSNVTITEQKLKTRITSKSVFQLLETSECWDNPFENYSPAENSFNISSCSSNVNSITKKSVKFEELETGEVDQKTPPTHMKIVTPFKKTVMVRLRPDEESDFSKKRLELLKCDKLLPVEEKETSETASLFSEGNQNFSSIKSEKITDDISKNLNRDIYGMENDENLDQDDVIDAVSRLNRENMEKPPYREVEDSLFLERQLTRTWNEDDFKDIAESIQKDLGMNPIVETNRFKSLTLDRIMEKKSIPSNDTPDPEIQKKRVKFVCEETEMISATCESSEKYLSEAAENVGSDDSFYFESVSEDTDVNGIDNQSQSPLVIETTTNAVNDTATYSQNSPNSFCDDGHVDIEKEVLSDSSSDFESIDSDNVPVENNATNLTMNSESSIFNCISSAKQEEKFHEGIRNRLEETNTSISISNVIEIENSENVFVNVSNADELKSSCDIASSPGIDFTHHINNDTVNSNETVVNYTIDTVVDRSHVVQTEFENKVTTTQVTQHFEIKTTLTYEYEGSVSDALNTFDTKLESENCSLPISEENGSTDPVRNESSIQDAENADQKTNYIEDEQGIDEISEEKSPCEVHYEFGIVPEILDDVLNTEAFMNNLKRNCRFIEPKTENHSYNTPENGEDQSDMDDRISCTNENETIQKVAISSEFVSEHLMNTENLDESADTNKLDIIERDENSLEECCTRFHISRLENQTTEVHQTFTAEVFSKSVDQETLAVYSTNEDKVEICESVENANIDHEKLENESVCVNLDADVRTIESAACEKIETELNKQMQVDDRCEYFTIDTDCCSPEKHSVSSAADFSNSNPLEIVIPESDCVKQMENEESNSEPALLLSKNELAPNLDMEFSEDEPPKSEVTDEDIPTEEKLVQVIENSTEITEHASEFLKMVDAMSSEDFMVTVKAVADDLRNGCDHSLTDAGPVNSADVHKDLDITVYAEEIVQQVRCQDAEEVAVELSSSGSSLSTNVPSTSSSSPVSEGASSQGSQVYSRNGCEDNLYEGQGIHNGDHRVSFDFLHSDDLGNNLDFMARLENIVHRQEENAVHMVEDHSHEDSPEMKISIANGDIPRPISSHRVADLFNDEENVENQLGSGPPSVEQIVHEESTREELSTPTKPGCTSIGMVNFCTVPNSPSCFLNEFEFSCPKNYRPMSVGSTPMSKGGNRQCLERENETYSTSQFQLSEKIESAENYSKDNLEIGSDSMIEAEAKINVLPVSDSPSPSTEMMKTEEKEFEDVNGKIELYSTFDENFIHQVGPSNTQPQLLDESTMENKNSPVEENLKSLQIGIGEHVESGKHLVNGCGARVDQKKENQSSGDVFSPVAIRLLLTPNRRPKKDVNYQKYPAVTEQLLETSFVRYEPSECSEKTRVVLDVPTSNLLDLSINQLENLSFAPIFNAQKPVVTSVEESVSELISLNLSKINTDPLKEDVQVTELQTNLDNAIKINKQQSEEIISLKKQLEDKTEEYDKLLQISYALYQNEKILKEKLNEAENVYREKCNQFEKLKDYADRLICEMNSEREEILVKYESALNDLDTIKQNLKIENEH